MISIHVPTRGTTDPGDLCSQHRNFNPRAHEGHDYLDTESNPVTKISIHVPTRGTTANNFAERGIIPTISIHVPTRGTTRPYYPRRFRNHFNPRAHEGHDRKRDRPWRRARFQSTCPRGARLDIKHYRVQLIISIHVPTRGTTVISVSPVSSPRFQSTCPRGARQQPQRQNNRHLDFNPRAHEGHDSSGHSYRASPAFQSTCPRGARLAPIRVHTQTRNFNPRAHEGHDHW